MITENDKRALGVDLDTTVKEILTVHIVNEGLSYDPEKWAQFSADGSRLSWVLNDLALPSVYMNYTIRRYSGIPLSDLELADIAIGKKVRDARYMRYYISLNDLAKLYCDCYELDRDNAQLIKSLITETVSNKNMAAKL